MIIQVEKSTLTFKKSSLLYSKLGAGFPFFLLLFASRIPSIPWVDRILDTFSLSSKASGLFLKIQIKPESHSEKRDSKPELFNQTQFCFVF